MKKIKIEKDSIKFLGIILNKDGIQLQKYFIYKIKDFSEDIRINDNCRVYKDVQLWKKISTRTN